MKKLFTLLLPLALIFMVLPSSSFAETVTPNGDPTGDDDVTSSFTQKMLSNAVYMAYYAEEDKSFASYPYGTGLYFAGQVRSGGPWDYKLQYGPQTHYWYNGRYMTGEDLGNMHYGFVGRGATFSATILKTAAGAYQIYSGISYPGWYNSYFDDPNDQANIVYGINMFDNKSYPRTSNMVTDSLTTEEKDALFSTLTEDEKAQIREIAYKNSLIVKEELKKRQ